jgi:hypothetical protein
MRVTGVVSDAGVGCSGTRRIYFGRGCVEVYFATGRIYMYVCIQVVGTDGVLPMLHAQTEKEGSKAMAS